LAKELSDAEAMSQYTALKKKMDDGTGMVLDSGAMLARSNLAEKCRLLKSGILLTSQAQKEAHALLKARTRSLEGIDLKAFVDDIDGFIASLKESPSADCPDARLP
jgi:hypothetical protein